MRILLIEDDTTLGAAVRDQIAADGQSVDWVTRLDAARDAMAATSYDLILLDLSLPGKDGRELLTEIRADEELQSIPVVVLTASTDQTDIVRSENLKVEAYLIKPVDLNKFLRLVRKLKRFWKEDMVVPPVDPQTVSDAEMSIGPIEIP